MKRESAENLTSHYYRLYTSIRPVVDTSPPTSFYNSPKSSFYRPFAVRKQTNTSNSHIRRKGREELAHFLALKRTRSQSQLGFNSFVRSKTESCLNLTELDRPNVRSKLLDSRNYQPPLRLRLHTGDSTSSEMSPLPPKPKRIQKSQIDDAYNEFKDRVLSEILLRNVYTSRVIEDCFQREIRKHPELRRDLLVDIMSDTMAELGINDVPRVASKKHVKISEETKRKMRSLSSGSQTPSSVQTSSASSSQKVIPIQKKPIKDVASNSKFRIDVSPPRTMSESTSSDIDEIVRRLSHSTENPSSLNEDETSSDDELNRIISKARQKS